MLIEILPRIWIADKRHSSCHVKNVVYLEKELSSKIYSKLNFIERQHSYSEYLEKFSQFLYYHTILKLKPIVLIDKSIHERHDAYMIVIAFIHFYSKIPWKKIYGQIKSKTIPFEFSSFSAGVLDLFHVT